MLLLLARFTCLNGVFHKRGEFILLSFIEWNLVTGNDDAIGHVT